MGVGWRRCGGQFSPEVAEVGAHARPVAGLVQECTPERWTVVPLETQRRASWRDPRFGPGTAQAPVHRAPTTRQPITSPAQQNDTCPGTTQQASDNQPIITNPTKQTRFFQAPHQAPGPTKHHKYTRNRTIECTALRGGRGNWHDVRGPWATYRQRVHQAAGRKHRYVKCGGP